jgi:hypothetical protein
MAMPDFGIPMSQALPGLVRLFGLGLVAAEAIVEVLARGRRGPLGMGRLLASAVATRTLGSVKTHGGASIGRRGGGLGVAEVARLAAKLTAILRVVCGRGRKSGCLGARRAVWLRRVKASRGGCLVLAPTALERPAVDIVAVHLADGHGCVLVGVHLDEGKAAVGLEAGLNHKAKVLEERDNVIGRGVGREVSDVAGRLPVGRLAQHDFITRDAVRRELVVAVRGRRGEAHSLHGLLLGHRGLSLLVGPVASDGPRPQPFTVHGAQSLLGFWAVTEGDEAVASRSSRLHVPHDAGFGNRAKSRESLEQDFVIDLVGQVADEDVEVTRSVLLGGGVGLVGPVDSDFL